MKSVAINGFGTIGKRVADAVAAQDDMKVIGVSKTRPNFEARTAVEEKDILYTLEFLKGNLSLRKRELKLQVLLKT